MITAHAADAQARSPSRFRSGTLASPRRPLPNDLLKNREQSPSAVVGTDLGRATEHGQLPTAPNHLSSCKLECLLRASEENCNCKWSSIPDKIGFE